MKPTAYKIGEGERKLLSKDMQEVIGALEEENRNLKLHIEAKDKAYTALLKDYEELKKERDEMKAEIEEWLNAIRQKI